MGNKIEEAIRHIGSIINNPAKNLREDVQGTARIIMVLLHYELKDAEGMEYYIRMANRYLTKRSAIFPFEKALLNFFRLSVRDSNPHKRKKALQGLQAKRLELLANDSKMRAFHFFNYEDWIESQILKLS